MRLLRTGGYACGALFLTMIVIATANAADNDRSARERDALVYGTRLYEVTETVHFGSDGVTVTSRDAVAVLMGFAPVGTPLCPTAALVTNPTAKTCTITGVGRDWVSLSTGNGPVSGTFSVVVNAPGNSSVHVPDLPLITGTFSGQNDLSLAVLYGIPLGSIRGRFIIEGDPLAKPVPFTGTFRLPFSEGPHHRFREAQGAGQAYYLSDDGRLIEVQPYEHTLGFPSVRLEIQF